MIIVERVNLDGHDFTHTYSDDDRYVVRDGMSYFEAWDPAEYGRTYTEGEKIEDSDTTTADELLAIILGEDAQ